MFDLDGTLADTLGDIAACGNHTLAVLGRPAIAVDRYRRLAGQGARYLVREALGVADDDPLVDRGLDVFRAYQLEHGMDLTRPYPGMAETLDELVARSVRLAVLSNKPDAATRAMVSRVFARWPFEAVLGQVDGRPLKPEPDGALQLTRAMNVEPAAWLYVGDTSVDMQTASAAGMTSVGVLWGFRDEAELLDSGAKHIIAHPRELLDLV
jgi:phosphoglycolate phosphatase